MRRAPPSPNSLGQFGTLASRPPRTAIVRRKRPEFSSIGVQDFSRQSLHSVGPRRRPIRTRFFAIDPDVERPNARINLQSAIVEAHGDRIASVIVFSLYDQLVLRPEHIPVRYRLHHDFEQPGCVVSKCLSLARHAGTVAFARRGVRSAPRTPHRREHYALPCVFFARGRAIPLRRSARRCQVDDFSQDAKARICFSRG